MRTFLIALCLLLPIQVIAAAVGTGSCASHSGQDSQVISVETKNHKISHDMGVQESQHYSLEAEQDHHQFTAFCDDCVGCVGCPAAVNTRSSQIFPLAHPSLGATPLAGFYSTSLPVEIRPPIAA